MASARKYAGLPDLDQAPDVYETPDLADDVSTIPATSARSPSVESEEGRSREDETESGVVRNKVSRDRAFSRFENSKVNAKRADFSDRLDGSRKYYSTSSRRRRQNASYRDDEDSTYEEVSDDEEESLDRKLARLKREIEEARLELAEKDEDRELFSDAPETKTEEENEDFSLDSINKLSEALDAVYTSRNGTSSKGSWGDLTSTISRFERTDTTPSTDNSATNIPRFTASSPEHQTQLSQAFAKAAEFDSRLSSLEQVLGISSLNMPDLAGAALITTSATASSSTGPLLPTINTLDRQVTALANSSATIDAASSKARKLIDQAEQLLKTRESYSAIDHPTTTDAENVSKINALYGNLSTIDALAPTLPVVLERLRTLRMLHAGAADAGATLDEMETRLDEQAQEIRQWRETLDQLETGLKSSEGGMLENVKSMESWVKQLEGRMSKLR